MDRSSLATVPVFRDLAVNADPKDFFNWFPMMFREIECKTGPLRPADDLRTTALLAFRAQVQNV